MQSPDRFSEEATHQFGVAAADFFLKHENPPIAGFSGYGSVIASICSTMEIAKRLI
jgi:hypothetical protein